MLSKWSKAKRMTKVGRTSTVEERAISPGKRAAQQEERGKKCVKCGRNGHFDFVFAQGRVRA